MEKFKNEIIEKLVGFIQAMTDADKKIPIESSYCISIRPQCTLFTLHYYGITKHPIDPNNLIEGPEESKCIFQLHEYLGSTMRVKKEIFQCPKHYHIITYRYVNGHGVQTLDRHDIFPFSTERIEQKIIALLDRAFHYALNQYREY